MEIINWLLKSDVGMQLIFLGFIFFVLLYFIIQSILNRRARNEIMRNIVNAQEQLIHNASALLARELLEYTESHLVPKVQETYEQLIARDLVPTVNGAANAIVDLSRAVSDRQETGMAELADRLAELFTRTTQQLMDQQVAVIQSLHQSADHFAEKLDGVNAMVENLTAQYNDVYQKAYALNQTVSSAVESLGGHLSGLGANLEKTAFLIEKMQSNMLESSEVIQTITAAASNMHQLAAEASEALANQQQTTARQLQEAVDAMRQHTEQSAKAVLDEFNAALSSSNNVMGETVAALRDIAAGMSETAAHFSEGISAAYARFSDSVEQKLAQISDAFAQSAEQEYQKVLASAETYSANFARDLETLTQTFESHLSNLQTITRHLSNTLASFKNDVDDSSARFELGIDKTVTKALEALDSALADIVQRLVAVTASISEAADALPRAVASIKESGN